MERLIDLAEIRDALLELGRLAKEWNDSNAEEFDSLVRAVYNEVGPYFNVRVTKGLKFVLWPTPDYDVELDRLLVERVELIGEGDGK